MSAKVYTLRSLIYTKYGEQKFALGCELVARWVKFEMRGCEKLQQRRCWSQELVLILCNLSHASWLYNANTEQWLSFEEAEALRQLFGLPTINQLYTNQ